MNTILEWQVLDCRHEPAAPFIASFVRDTSGWILQFTFDGGPPVIIVLESNYYAAMERVVLHMRDLDNNACLISEIPLNKDRVLHID